MDDASDHSRGNLPANETMKPDPEFPQDEIRSIEVDPLPDYPPLDTNDDFTAETSEDLGNDFENNLADMLAEFNNNSSFERIARAPSTSLDTEYAETLSAIEQKRLEITAKESLGQAVDGELVQLKSLEDTLYQADMRKKKLQDFEIQQIEDTAMFFAEGSASDVEELEMTQAPTRHEASGITGLHDQIQISDDDLGDDNQLEQLSDSKGKRSRHDARKPMRKTRTTLGKSGVRKRMAARPRRGGHQANGDMFNYSSLLRNNVAEDAERNQRAGPQPTFEGKTNKQDALTALLASIPKEHQDTKHGMRTKLDRACRQFHWKGNGSMKADGQSGRWKLKGMASSLENFQLLSTAWGVERERSPTLPFGGILADTMGYGKTVQMITIMVENQPKKDAKNKTTLIVVPSSIITQWMEEIAKHVEDGIMENIMIYKSGSRILAPDVCKELRKKSVVITTYHEVMRNYPKCEPPMHLVTEKAKDDWWSDHFEKAKGPLLSMPFHRVVLDEAQMIKNHESRTSKACRLLTSKYRWVLTGTPLSNCIEEFFPYFHFLSVEGAGSFAQFKQNYGKRTDKTMQRLDAILRTIMVRRTGRDRLFGVPLTKLPALDYQTIKVAFNPVEKAIYGVVRQRFINRVNDWSAKGKINQLSRSIFTMLLRLRQMCAHILMVTSTIRDLMEIEDIERLWKTIERHAHGAADAPGKRTAVVLQRFMKEAGNEPHQAPTVSTESTRQPSNETIDLTINDADFDFRSLFYRLQHEGSWDKIRNRSHCAACNAVAVSPKLSVPCGHMYCADCIQVLLESAGQSNFDFAECMTCYGLVTGSVEMRAMEAIAAEAGQNPRLQPLATNVSGPKKGKAKKEEELAWLDTPHVEQLSTKCQAIVSTMEEWLKRDTGAKIVVFSLFIPMLKVLGKACSRKSWGFQEYTGQVSIEARIKALNKWKDPAEEHPVLLMSMRAGGVGLNLVEASYVIICDPWWNEPAEDQAFSRVYRIGQQRDCVVRRFIIADAVDSQLMLHLQKLKAQECDRVVDGRSNEKLNIADLLKLFGPTRRNPKTNAITVEDDEEESDGLDDFVIADDHVAVDDSDIEETMPAPARPRDQ